ncbi:hypothetical protein GCM10009530_50150 [Microbispora corallina]|uniref:Acyl-CoA carboxylase subunit epsilon n=1 Tax=Microbispora corallina TaxID=83302 RepID=A0ABQ4FQE5_9ACTN|nr:acyl-CoA carboxylase epsilon subunit [Microbispora corallina]GIH37034.1 hypothetical protein Mco01_00340 [Microbispora corallina]
MSAATAPDGREPVPVVREPAAVVRGAPTDEQLAAVLAVLAASGRAREGREPERPAPRPRWSVEAGWRLDRETWW